MKNSSDKNFIKRIACTILAVTTAFALTSCENTPIGRSIQNNVDTKATVEQLYMMTAGRRNEIAEVYTENVFPLKLDELGTTYKDAFFALAKDYCEKTYLMCQMASDKKIDTTIAERKDIEERAQLFMDEYNDCGNTYKIGNKDAEKVLTDLLLIEKLRAKLISDAKIEISESEAKVIDIIRIEFDDEDDANEILESINNSPDVPFATAARRHSVNSETELKVGRGDLGDSIDDVIFELDEGEISPVIESNGKYYIIKIEKGYDAEATALRKEEMRTRLEGAVVNTAYENYVRENPYELDADEWNEVRKMCEEHPSIPDIFKF